MKDLMEELFEIWLKENHPNYNTAIIIFGGIGVLLFIASIVLMWFWVSWWKLSISSIVYFLLIGLVKSVCDDHYIDEFKRNK